MSKKYYFLIILVVSYLFNPESVLGGAEYILKCKNKECNYSTKIDFGGGLGFDQIMGYCANCGDFVYLTWKSREREPDGSFSNEALKGPDPVAEIWDLSTKEPAPLYKCIKCSQPFIPIKNIENIKYCPKCKQPSLKVEETGLLYD